MAALAVNHLPTCSSRSWLILHHLIDKTVLITAPSQGPPPATWYMFSPSVARRRWHAPAKSRRAARALRTASSTGREAFSFWRSAVVPLLGPARHWMLQREDGSGFSVMPVQVPMRPGKLSAVKRGVPPWTNVSSRTMSSRLILLPPATKKKFMSKFCPRYTVPLGAAARIPTDCVPLPVSRGKDWGRRWRSCVICQAISRSSVTSGCCASLAMPASSARCSASMW
mmetsp:Transcript_73434/g.215364  ORF Transcript_73434/g.215364 Transcript_73434/m.215364 type:complete len:226 (+) Transcript_73434:279-956(+)